MHQNISFSGDGCSGGKQREIEKNREILELWCTTKPRTSTGQK